MKLVVIYGAPGVGKLTTATALSKKTGYPVLHNHMTIDLAAKFFPFGTRPFNDLLRQLRLCLIRELQKEKVPGLIWTSGMPNTFDNIKFYKKLKGIIKNKGGSVYYVKLICNQKEQEKRLRSKPRKIYKKIRSLKELKQSSLDFSTPPFDKKTLVVDNSKVTAPKVASKILEFIS